MLANQLQTAEREQHKLEEAKTNLIADVSHYLKISLSYITGYSSLLLDREKKWETTEQTKFLYDIHDKSVLIADFRDLYIY